MSKLKPKLFSVMKNYTKEQFVKDFISGIIVVIIAMPLSIALAIASGVNPEKGLHTAIIAGFLISFLGGSRVQIGGPSATFTVISYTLIQQYGVQGLAMATIMAGIILVVLGVCRLGSLVKYIPYTVTTGITASIAVIMFSGQIKDFLGLSIDKVPADFAPKMAAIFQNIGSVNFSAVIVGVTALLIIVLWPKVTQKVPGSLIAIIATVIMVKFLNLKVDTIGSVFGELSRKLPVPALPAVDFSTVEKLAGPAFTIAILAAIEGLLSCVVSDGMIGSKHNSNMEVVAEGVANIVSGFFGGLPATGVLARTAANLKNGARTPIAGMVHAVGILIVMVSLMPLASLIPMTTLSAILIVLSYNMCDWEGITGLVKRAPKSDIIVFACTFFVGIFIGLASAIVAGIVLAVLLFMKRMIEVTDVSFLTNDIEGIDLDESEDPDATALKHIPKDVIVYEINGPFFFGAADKFVNMTDRKAGKPKVIIVRMRNVPAMDVTAMRALEQLYDRCKKRGIRLLISKVQKQPRNVMEKAGFVQRLGEENFCENVDSALERAKGMLANEAA